MKQRTLERVISVGLMVLVLAVLCQVAGHDFLNFDDGTYITKNSVVQSGLSKRGFFWAFTSMEASNWHPMAWLSHMLDCQLYGLNPAGHHLTSLFLHMANTLLLFLVLRTATGSLWKSAMVAALFGIHPVHVESVAWISERKDVLSGFFWMLTIFAYIRYCRRPGHDGYVLILILFSLGLMAKPMLVTLPFVLLLLDFWPLGRLRFPGQQGDKSRANSLGHIVWEKIPLFVLSAASSVVTFAAQSEGRAVTTFEILPLKARVLNALVSYVRYMEKAFWPHDLAIFYPHPGNTLAIWQGMAAGLFLAVISVLVVLQRSKRPFLIVGWLWFLVTLVPVIGILQVGGQSMADRYTYIPFIGIFIMCVWGVSGLIKRVPYGRILFACSGSGILICLSIVTCFQVGHWQDSKAIFRHAISVTNRNHVAHCSLGTAFLDEGRLDEAVIEYKKALDIWPSYPDALNNLGVACVRKGLVKEALTHYDQAIKADPKYVLAHLNMAEALTELGQLNEAVSHYSEALFINPECGSVHNSMGVLLAKLKKMDEAVAHLTLAIDLCPNCIEPHNNLGKVLAYKGDFDGAVRQLERAIELRPDYAEAHNNLGLVFLQLGAVEEAIYHIASALHFKPDYAKARANLRRAVYSLGPEKSTPAHRE